LKKRLAVGGVIAVLVVTLFTLAALATSAEMFFSSDKNGQNRVTNVQEGDEIWIAVYDPDQNIDCDLRDKMAPDLKIMDPKTGAYIIWNPDPNFNTGDYLEETGADTGLFVSSRAFQVGTRENYATQQTSTHVVDDDNLAFQWGHYLYADDTSVDTVLNNVDGDNRGWFGNNHLDAYSQAMVNAGLMPAGLTANAVRSLEYQREVSRRSVREYGHPCRDVRGPERRDRRRGDDGQDNRYRGDHLLG